MEPNTSVDELDGAGHQGVPNVQTLHLRCSCQSELKLESYNIPAALSYAKRWWKDHKDH